MCGAVLRRCPQYGPFVPTAQRRLDEVPPAFTPGMAFYLHRLRPLTAVPIVGLMNIEAWFKDLTNSSSLREAAEASGVSKSTLSRNLDANTMTPETIIALCRAYDRSPVAGLIETGHINDYELHGPDVEVALREATNEQLLDEIMRRSDPQARHLFSNEGDEGTIGLAPHLTPVSEPSASLHDDDDGLVQEWDDSVPHAADSSPDEQAEREKRGEDLID